MKNTTGSVLVFRDDAPDKHFIKPGDEFEVTGPQHIPMVEALIAGGAPTPADDPVAPPAGEAGATPKPRKRR